MTNREQEAIEELKSLSPSEEAIEIVLSLLENKDLIIKEMAKAWKQDDKRSVEEIIEYFTNIVKERGKDANIQ